MTPATDTITAATQPSARLARALDSEREKLRRSLRRLQHDRAELRARLAQIEAEIQASDERLVLLSQLRGDDNDCHESRRSPVNESQRLTGPAIRMTAVALVRDLPQGEQALHYRRWLEMVESAGYEVGGQKPAATFLSQISRSPVVRRTTRAGHYEIDREAPARLRRRLARLREELSGGALDRGEPIDLHGVRERRTTMLREIEKRERELEEAIAALTLPVARLAQTA
jgi:IS30 family transposase